HVDGLFQVEAQCTHRLGLSNTVGEQRGLGHSSRAPVTRALNPPMVSPGPMLNLGLVKRESMVGRYHPPPMRRPPENDASATARWAASESNPYGYANQ